MSRGEWSYGEPPNSALRWALGELGSGYYGPPKISEGPTDREGALDSLARVVKAGEGPSVIDSYERAAWAVGCTAHETDRVIYRAAEDFARSVTIVAMRDK